ncbi:hypothetical protein J3Q64DRAFT_1860090 [Phycomyces blakesleeanus]|uniref:F-box domain-containing protein n=1 Tax=Phycomyces blakesleeanus TaxID=4837 RepID=A0ABR3B0C1_PHYBL
MGFSELRFEILAKIADNLSRRANLSCALTCKGWRYAFKKALCRDKRFVSYDDALTLTNIIKDFENVPTLHGIWVPNLHIPHYFSVTELLDIEFSDLLRYLPNLKCLDVPIIFRKYIHTEPPISDNARYELQPAKIPLGTEKKISDNVWKSLESLRIHCKGTSELQLAKDLVEFVNAYSMLQRLDIFDDAGSRGTVRTVSYFESIHQHLKRQSSIKLVIYLSSDFSTTLDPIPNTTQAFAVTSLYINTSRYEDKRNSWNPLCPHYLGFKYPKLCSLKLKELFCALKVPLKNLTLEATQTGEILCISGSNVSLDIADLLDKCVALKQLKFCGGKLLINSDMIIDGPKQQYGLLTLTLHECSVATKVFSHLSFRCKNSKHMDLRALWIEESVCEKTGCLLIDMSHTFLKTLKIGQVQFHGSDRVHSYDDWASLVLVSELHDSPLSNERDTIKRTEIDSNYPRTECNNITWLYTYNDMEYTGEETLSTTEISKDEANIAIEYYQNFQSNQINAISIDDSSYNGDDPTVAWKYELYKGYAELRFGKIQCRPCICESDFVER